MTIFPNVDHLLLHITSSKSLYFNFNCCNDSFKSIKWYMVSFYKYYGYVDHHNWYRQDDIILENKAEVREWTFWVFSSMFPVFMVDSYLMYNRSQDGLRGKLLNAFEFVILLAGELIENKYNEPVLAGKRKQLELQAPQDISKTQQT